MLRHRELFSTCARLCLAGLLASCASFDDADSGSADPDTDLATSDVLRASGDHTTLALTADGLVRGVETATMRAFRGIPYAAAPVDELRWRPPVRHARWHDILDATQFANHCPQAASPFGRESATEDCLFLNVYAPRHAVLRPVMVWIHGGALVTGESDDYDPTRLVEQGDVLVVTINYRLGALGFLAHPALSAGSPDHTSGNYGLMDQQEALRWVHRNILLFGGDPSRVTIFGESAGGLSVHEQLVAPGSQGLFQRAIVESGAYQLTQPSLATGEVLGFAFATRAGCIDQSAACLRGLSVAQVLASQAGGTSGASPVIDGTFLPRSVGAAFASGQFNHVPVMEGANHDEWRLFVGETELVTGPVTAQTYPAAIQATLGVPAALVPLFAAQYPLASFPSPALAVSALGTDAIFACNARFAAQKLSQFVPTFAYEFNDEAAPERFLPPVSFPYGAAHASELQYLFDLPVAVPAPPLDAAQQQLSEAMIDYWTTFARTGQPSSFHTPSWTRFAADQDTMQSLVPATPRPETSFATDHNCAFWDALR
ncbi:MAG TPA: carboxylesterase family protein [Kofleriaceae bacterium]|jgi:para-nitrobenzyl esterase|nr:carboxylesterase family protein [Kofleriaceae bacterium]